MLAKHHELAITPEASGLDRGEWRSRDQGQGCRAGSQWGQREAARARRVRAAVHDRSGRFGGEGHVCERAGAVPQNLLGPGRRLVSELRKEVGGAVELYAPYAGQAAGVLL